ncbi:synaptotagmin-14-like [Anoplopoma fimbria]|uniref:synaptotagmin-14-like n=1 Tax=Anoplopoma fimbria TaxID=229290 RepID=UPI0023EC398C|nr:synaptotagmin-14-like [Anoplopoma fimbria]
MAFFKSFQQNIPSVNISSLLDSVTSRVDDLANAVSDATYAVSDQLTEQVTTIISKVQDEEDGENSGQESGQISTAQEGGRKVSNAASKTNQSGDAIEAESTASQLEWEWRDGCWRVKKTEAELAEEEKRKKEEKEVQEYEGRLSKQKKQKEEGEEKVEVADSLEREGDDEEEAELSKSPSTVKRKKADKKKRKGAKEKGVLSDSEEDKGPEAVAQQNTTSAWSNKSKQSTEQGGYSSEASSERAANSIQRIKKKSSVSEPQPPPYQDEGSAARVSSRSRSERAVRRGSSPQHCDSEASEASVDQDTESYLNKGCEEDIPSDSTAVLGPEDGSGPQLPTAYEPEPFAKYGTLDVAFEYDSGEQWLAVTVTAATDIPALKQTGNIAWQVHLVLLPTKKQRAKTGVQKGPCPVFTETFKFSRVEQEALGDYAVRFRLYSIRRMKKEKVLGEKVFYLTKLNLQGKIALPVTLEPGSELTGCGSVVSVSRSAGALSYRSTEDSSMPEILLGLLYNSATGQLSAEVIQGSHFKTTASDKPVNGLFCCIKHFVGGQLYIMRDTYVKLTMLDSKGKEMSKCKTAVCRGQPNPTYKETFLFQVALFQLSEVSLVLSVFCRRSSMRPRERLGWVSLGLNSTGEEQQTHWTEMKEGEGQQVCHWHTLTDT